MPVSLAAVETPRGTPLTSLPVDVDGALALARELGRLPVESTRDRWETLAALAAHDLGVARAIEPHLDAVSILEQAGHPTPEGSWGVFAAEGGDDPLVATEASGEWRSRGPSRGAPSRTDWMPHS